LTARGRAPIYGQIYGAMQCFLITREICHRGQTRGAFVYGGGVDVPMFKHVALRAQYRGFIYKTPDFETTTLKVDKYTHSAVPSAGLVFVF
jgi:hypothetical protein